MKNTLLTFLACMGIITAASAEGPVTNFYLKSYDGLNWLNTTDARAPDFEIGYMGSIALGYKFNSNIVHRAELEFAYRTNDLNHVEDLFGNRYSVSGRSESVSVFANTYYDFYNCSRFTPYLGFGLGYSSTRVKISDYYTSVEGTSQGVGAQFIGGVSTCLTDRIDIGLEYRYHLYRQNYHEQNLGATLTVNF